MKFIIEATGQIIVPRGRKFYFPPWDKWIEDRVLPRYDQNKLAERFGVYKLEEERYDNTFYKPTGYTDTRDGLVVTRTYAVEPRKTAADWGREKFSQYKKEGIKLYAEAIRIEPILQFTGDTMDLVVYKQSLLDTFLAARGELLGIVQQSEVSQYDKYLQIRQHSITWPDLPIDEDTWREYGSA